MGPLSNTCSLLSYYFLELKQKHTTLCLAPTTYTATSNNLSIKSNGVVFVGELVSNKVVHLFDTNT